MYALEFGLDKSMGPGDEQKRPWWASNSPAYFTLGT